MSPRTISTNKFGFELRQYHSTANGRAQVEHFISKRFQQEYNATITKFMPLLVAVVDSGNNVVAATGMRSGAEVPFFLESYLDHPVETALLKSSQDDKKYVERRAIVEIGNLASTSIASSRFLFRSLIPLCLSHNYQWVVFTGCKRLCNTFESLNLNLIELGQAKENRLGETKGDWGSYYHYPRSVMAGYLTTEVKQQYASCRISEAQYA